MWALPFFTEFFNNCRVFASSGSSEKLHTRQVLSEWNRLILGEWTERHLLQQHSIYFLKVQVNCLQNNKRPEVNPFQKKTQNICWGREDTACGNRRLMFLFCSWEDLSWNGLYKRCHGSCASLHESLGMFDIIHFLQNCTRKIISNSSTATNCKSSAFL